MRDLLRIDALDEKLSYGAAQMADLEALELLLIPLLRRSDSKQIARAMIEKFRTFGRAINASALELAEIEGLGVADIAAVKAASAIAPLLLRKRAFDAPAIRMWDDLINYLGVKMQDERVEVLRIIFLNAHGRLIADEEMQRGSITQVAIIPRDVIRRSLELDAVSIVIVHNHPSGSLRPSQQDILMTKEIQRVGESMNIAVHDHIIVGKGKYMSLRSANLM